MDPSLVLCSVTNSFSAPEPRQQVSIPLSFDQFNKSPIPFTLNDVSSSINSTLKNPFEVPLRNFAQKEALLLADIDATFRLTDESPISFWQYTFDDYPARQYFSVTYLTPQIFGSFVFVNWNTPGSEYLTYRWPEYFTYGLFESKEKAGPTDPNQSSISIEDNAISDKSLSKFIEKIQSSQVAGVDLVLSFEDLRRSLLLALKTLKTGGNCLLRLTGSEEKGWFEIATSSFDKVWIFKPMLSNPLSSEQFLICISKKEGLLDQIESLGLNSPPPISSEVSRWLDYEQSRLIDYQNSIVEGKIPKIFPSKCYTVWNLPDLPPPESCQCEGEDESSLLALEHIEEQTNTSEPPSESAGWNSSTGAYSLLPSPKLVNIRGQKNNPGYFDVYIGRPFYQGGWKLQGSIWANPFTTAKCGTVEKAVENYEKYLLSKPDLLKRIPELAGKKIGCWCSNGDDNNPCHGKVLVQLFNKIQRGEITI